MIERCSEPGSAEPHLERLKEKFIAKNYPVKLVEEQFEKAKRRDRRTLIFQQRKNKESSDKKVRLIFTHNRGNPPLHKWIRESKKFLVSAKGRDFAQNFQIAYKQPKNLKKMVSGCQRSEREVGGQNSLPPRLL